MLGCGMHTHMVFQTCVFETKLSVINFQKHSTNLTFRYVVDPLKEIIIINIWLEHVVNSILRPLCTYACTGLAYVILAPVCWWVLSGTKSVIMNCTSFTLLILSGIYVYLLYHWLRSQNSWSKTLTTRGIFEVSLRY